jgi:hypothetical protein
LMDEKLRLKRILMSPNLGGPDAAVAPA